MDVTDIKAANVRKVLDTLRFSSGLTKREIASDTGLSFSTVSNICNDLEEHRILYEVKSSDVTTVGRTPDRFYFHCAKYCSICVELQRENLLSFAVLDFANRCLFQTDRTVTAGDDLERWLDFIQATYRQLLQSGEFGEVEFVGIGISIPGIQDNASGEVINVPYRSVDGVPLQQIVSRRIGLPCYVENEANLCAVSMAQNRKEDKNLLYLLSSAGLGVGVICEGRLLRGKNGYAAEIAHIPIGDPDLVCPFCGCRGCIENDLAQRGMDAFGFPGLTPEETDRLARDRGRKLGELLAILINLFDPQTVYLGGGGLKNYNQLAPHALSVLEKRAPFALGKGVRIQYDADSVGTALRGINQLVYENWYPL